MKSRESFGLKPEIPYEDDKGRVIDKDAAHEEAKIINEAKKEKRLGGILGPSKKTMRNAEMKAEEVGRAENKKLNEERVEKLKAKWEEEARGLRGAFNEYFKEVFEISRNLLNKSYIEDEEIKEEDFAEIRDRYAEGGEILEAMDISVEEGIKLFKPDNRMILKDFEEAKKNRAEASKIILRSTNATEVFDALIKIRSFLASDHPRILRNIEE